MRTASPAVVLPKDPLPGGLPSPDATPPARAAAEPGTEPPPGDDGVPPRSARTPPAGGLPRAPALRPRPRPAPSPAPSPAGLGEPGPRGEDPRRPRCSPSLQPPAAGTGCGRRGPGAPGGHPPPPARARGGAGLCGEPKPAGRLASRQRVPLPGAEARVRAAVRHRKEGRRPEVPSARAAALTDLIKRKEAREAAEPS